MNGNPYRKVQPGDPLVIPAAAYNEVLDAVALSRPNVRARQQQAKRSPILQRLSHGGDVRVRNIDPGANDIAVGHQVILMLPQILSDEELQARQAAHTVDGHLGPTAAYEPGKTTYGVDDNLAIALEDIRHGGVGLVRVSGAAYARVAIFSDKHRFADTQPIKAPKLVEPCFQHWVEADVWELQQGSPDCEPLWNLPDDATAGNLLADLGPLRSSPIGSAQILWREDQGNWDSTSLPGALGIAWCLVRLSTPPLFGGI